MARTGKARRGKERQGKAMGIYPSNYSGKPVWDVSTGYGPNRKRQRFYSEKEALRALKDYTKQRQELGAAWEALTAKEKADVGAILAEMRQRGWLLRQVWEAFKGLPNVAAQASCTLGDAIKELVAAKVAAGRREKYTKELAWYLGKFAEGRESVDVRSITPAIIEDWFRARKETPIARRGHVSLLSALFAHCWRKRYITENPCKRLEHVPIDRDTPCTLTTRQSVRAMAWSHRHQPELVPWLALTLFAGLRPDSEADYIAWKHIDLKHKRVTVARSKVRGVVPRIVELDFCPPAFAWLRAAKEMGCKLPVNSVKANLTRKIRRLRRYLGISRKQDIFRHTAASNLLAHHQDAGKVASFLGNSPRVLLTSYKALVVREDAARWLAIMPKPRHFRKVDWKALQSKRIKAGRHRLNPVRADQSAGVSS